MREKKPQPKNLNTLFKLWSRITENINAQFNLCYVILISLTSWLNYIEGNGKIFIYLVIKFHQKKSIFLERAFILGIQKFLLSNKVIQKIKMICYSFVAK